MLAVILMLVFFIIVLDLYKSDYVVEMLRFSSSNSSSSRSSSSGSRHQRTKQFYISD